MMLVTWVSNRCLTSFGIDSIGQNLEVDATHHIQTCEWCLKFKSRQDQWKALPITSYLSFRASLHGLLDCRKSPYRCQCKHFGHNQPLYMICERNYNLQPNCLSNSNCFPEWIYHKLWFSQKTTDRPGLKCWVPVDQRIEQTGQYLKGANNTMSPREEWPVREI